MLLPCSIQNNRLPFSILGSTFKSPSKQTKSRWEPLQEEKPLDKPPYVGSNNMRYIGSEHAKGRDRKKMQPFSIYSQSQDDTEKISAAEQNSVRPPKRQRLTAENGDGSSDSEKEQNLSSYYTSEISLANTPKERRKRDNKSKRFENGHGN